MSVNGEAKSLLYVVDHCNQQIWEATFEECHRAPGKLHRAFAVWVVDPDYNTLMVYEGGFLSVPCEGHPVVGEKTLEAALRKSDIALGCRVNRVSERTPCYVTADDPFDRAYVQQFFMWADAKEKECIRPVGVFDYAWMPFEQVWARRGSCTPATRSGLIRLNEKGRLSKSLKTFV